jgi:hypothetical protein
MEEFVHGLYESSSSFITKNTNPANEIWTLPKNKPHINYISILRNIPAFVVTNLWSPEINLMSKPEHELRYNYAVHNPKKINILITEANISFCKNAWIPIMAAEWLHKHHPELIESIYVFNFPKNGHHMIEDLSIKSLLKKFSRIAIPEILYNFNNQTAMPIFVSYQSKWEGNYSYYEALYFGYPLVHNSPDLQDNGYAYKEEDIAECANQIVYAANHHNQTLNAYLKKTRDYLKTIAPENADVCAVYSQLVNEGIRKSLSK